MVSRAPLEPSLSGSRDGSLRREGGHEGGHNPNVGRWPSNLILVHRSQCSHGTTWKCVEGCPVATLDQQSIARGMHGAGHGRDVHVDSTYDATSFDLSGDRRMHRFGDTGGASRFYPQVTSEEALLAWLSRLLGRDVLRVSRDS